MDTELGTELLQHVLSKCRPVNVSPKFIWIKSNRNGGEHQSSPLPTAILDSLERGRTIGSKKECRNHWIQTHEFHSAPEYPSLSPPEKPQPCLSQIDE